MDNELVKRFLSSIIILPLSIIFIFYGSIFFIFFLSILFLICSYEWIKMNKKNIINKIYGIIFLIFSFYSAYEIRENVGFKFLLFIILVTVSTDLGGYIFGKILKGPKLTAISPNKTYSGLIGSFILSLIVGFIYIKNFSSPLGEIIQQKLPQIYNNYELNIFFLILLISFISQVGDLIISYFKRLAKIKDTGKILPGHGGILDRIDGLIFVLPIFYIII